MTRRVSPPRASGTVRSPGPVKALPPAGASPRAAKRRRGIEWLKEFGLVPEEDFAAMLGVSVKTLKNRPRDRLPEFVQIGHRRLFKADSVRAYFERHTVGQAGSQVDSQAGRPAVRPAA